MHLLSAILFWFCIQGSRLASEFMTCYPTESISYAVVNASFKIYCDFQIQINLKQSNQSDDVLWKKNGVTFQTEIKLEYLSNKQRLIIDIQNLSKSDSGNYTCLYFGNGKLVESNPIELVVLPRPSNPTCTPSESNFYFGDIVSLICETYPYSSLKLFWKIDSLPDAVIVNITNKNKISSIMKFTATKTHIGTECMCTMSTEEGIRFCTSTVVIKKRTEVRIEGPVHFTLNQPATLSCSTLYKTGRSMLNESRQSDFEWRSTNDELFNGILEQANGSSNLTIQKVSDKMHGENITCTYILDDAMGSDTVTILINRHLVTHEDGIAAVSTTDKDSGGTIDENPFNFIDTPTEILISIIISVFFLCLVLLTILQCFKYFKRPANQNLQVGNMQAIINYGNDGSTHAIPLAILAPTASNTSLRAYPSELSITSNRQTDNRVSEMQTLTRSSRPRFGDTLPSPPSSIEVLAFHRNTVESAAPIIEEVSEMIADPLYDEINEKSLKSHVSTSHHREKLTEDYNGVLAETSAQNKKEYTVYSYIPDDKPESKKTTKQASDDYNGVLAKTSAHNENTLSKECTVYNYIPDDKPEFKTPTKQVSDEEKTEIEQYNEVSLKERKCVNGNSVVLGTSIGERHKTLVLCDADTFTLERGNIKDTVDTEALTNFQHLYASPIPKLLRKVQEDIVCYQIDPQKQTAQNQTDSSKESNLLYAKVVPKS